MAQVCGAAVHHDAYQRVGELRGALAALQALLGVGEDVELLGELQSAVDFLVRVGVEVEHDALQVHYQYVREFGNHGSAGDVHLPVAFLAVVVADGVAGNQLLQGLVEGFGVLHVHGEVVEVLSGLVDVAALLADHLTAALAAEDPLREVLVRGVLEFAVQLVEDHVQELLGVLLHCGVRGVAAGVLEGEAEGHGVVRVPVCELQVGEEALQLVQDVVVDGFAGLLQH